MTFEEWIKDQPDGYYSNDAIFQAGAASRDAEFARLRAINSKLCEKSNWYVIHTARLEEERDQLRAQINVMLEALEYCVTQVGELATVPGIASALSSTPEQSLAEYRNKAADRIEELERDRDEWKARAEFSYRQRDQLRAQIKQKDAEIAELVVALELRRDWFETQAKVVSKGGPSSWELMLLRDERDACDEALAKVSKP